MDAAPAPPARCPRCAAGLRPGAPWCTLCYADLRPAEPVADVSAQPVPGVRRAPLGPELAGQPWVASYAGARPVLDPLTAPLEQLLDPDRDRDRDWERQPGLRPDSQPDRRVDVSLDPAPAATWPCATCECRNPFDADRCASCGKAFLSAVRGGDRPLLVLPVVGDVLALTRGRRLALGAAFVLACILLTALLGVLSG